MRFNCTLDRFEADKAVLIGARGEKIIWPKNLLPEGAHEGMALNFDILEEKEREAKEKQTAKDIINEIISQT